MWHLHPSVALGVLLLWGVYVLGIGPWRRKYGWSETVNRKQVRLFGTGLVLLVFTLQGPLHELSDRYLFSAHMVQHLMLTLVIPPLLLWGTPDWLLRPLTRIPAVNAVVSVLTRPAVAFLLANGALIVWHVPVMYDLALRVHGIHIVQHLMYLATATLAWWPIMGMLPEWPRLTSPMQMTYLFLSTLPTGVIGSILSLSDRLIYKGYAETPKLWGLTPVSDQVLGGLLMWVGGSTLYLGAITAIFFAWFYREERESAAEQKAAWEA